MKEDEDSNVYNTLEERNLHKLMKKTIHSTTLGLSRHVGRSLNGSGEWLW
jgi:hypothetical protein